MGTRLIDRREACRLLGISTATLYRLRKSGGFPDPIYIGVRSPRWELDEVTELVARLRRMRSGATSAAPATPATPAAAAVVPTAAARHRRRSSRARKASAVPKSLPPTQLSMFD
jgi:predicted DNA-binding transcriptional regulator AlpA